MQQTNIEIMNKVDMYVCSYVTVTTYISIQMQLIPVHPVYYIYTVQYIKQPNYSLTTP